MKSEVLALGFTLLLVSLFMSPLLGDESPQNADFPSLVVPESASSEELIQCVIRAKQARPTNFEQYKAQQTAIKQASSRLLKKLKKDDPNYAQAEIDSISSSVALLTFFSDKDQAAIIQQLSDFLKSRKTLSLQDIQTGMLAAGMLELQPQKQPAHDIYSLINQLLETDKRPEMQSLRLNIQASIRRLELLGRKLDFQATSMDGKQWKTEDFAGKFVLVNFFASWSQPSLAEQALLKTQYQKYSDKGLAVVGICMDEQRSELDKILASQMLPWPVVHDNAPNPLDRLQFKLGVSALPTTFLINKEGTVVSLEARSSELNRLMQMLFETPTPAAPQDAKPQPTPAKEQASESPAEPATSAEKNP